MYFINDMTGQCHKYNEYEINPKKIMGRKLKIIEKKFFLLFFFNNINIAPIVIKVASGKKEILKRKLTNIKLIAASK